jgi:hypothetical protein
MEMHISPWISPLTNLSQGPEAVAYADYTDI